MNNKIYFFESITPETEKEVDSFIPNHNSAKITYWEWRECLALINKVYKELEQSTQEFGKKIDEILGPYKNHDISILEQGIINDQLSKIAVVPNQRITKKLSKLNEYHY